MILCRRGKAEAALQRLRDLPSLSRATPSAVSGRCPELLGCPISRSFTTSCVCPELRPLPSPGVTRLQRYCKPLRHPTVPSLSLTGVWLVIPDRALGLPVLRALSLCTCCRQYPGAATGRRLRSSRLAVSAFPEVAVGSACTSTFSELARRSLALRPAHSRRHLYVTSYTEGFSHFVTSMTAPVASGWSVRRVGLAPTGKRRLLTAHANSGHSAMLGERAKLIPKYLLSKVGVLASLFATSTIRNFHICYNRPVVATCYNRSVVAACTRSQTATSSVQV